VDCCRPPLDEFPKACDSWVGRFQFSVDLYDYKSNWATGIQPHANLELFHEGLYSRFVWWTKKKALPTLCTLRDNMWTGARNHIPVQPS
jgi:hypothetical protein